MREVKVVSALIFNELQEILLVKNKNRENPYWSLPSGYVKPGETLREAVIRETKEETGLTVSVSDLYSVREVIFTKREHHAIVFTFLAEVMEGELNIDDPDEEVMDVKWTDLETANALLSYLPYKIRYVTSDQLLPSYHYQVSYDF